MDMNPTVSTTRYLLLALTALGSLSLFVGCNAGPSEGDSAQATGALETCECSGEGVEAEDVEIPFTDDDATGAADDGVFPAPPELAPLADITIKIGKLIVRIPQLKGDACHAGGDPVHITIKDTFGREFKMKPGPNGWVTVDGRPGPSSNVLNKVVKNQTVQRAMAKIAKAAGYCVAALVMIGYDASVSAGEVSGFTILDKIKALRSIQDICSPDENGEMRGDLARTGVIPGGAGSGKDLYWEVIRHPTAGEIYTVYTLEDDCTFWERQFGCTNTKKVYLIGPEQQQQVPNGCLEPLPPQPPAPPPPSPPACANQIQRPCSADLVRCLRSGFDVADPACKLDGAAYATYMSCPIGTAAYLKRCGY